jgi:hypothetical protein
MTEQQMQKLALLNFSFVKPKKAHPQGHRKEEKIMSLDI